MINAIRWHRPITSIIVEREDGVDGTCVKAEENSSLPTIRVSKKSKTLL